MKYFDTTDPGRPRYRRYDRGGTATPGGTKVKAGDPAVEGDGWNPILKSIDDRINGVEVAGGGVAGGEVNTASNVGAGGVGLYKQKVAVDLQFKNINAGSSKLTVTDDPTHSEVDIDVVPAQINLDDLGDVNAPTPANAYVVTWNTATSKWIASVIPAQSLALDDLTDVNAPSPNNNDALTWDNVTSKWIPKAVVTVPLYRFIPREYDDWTASVTKVVSETHQYLHVEVSATFNIYVPIAPAKTVSSITLHCKMYGPNNPTKPSIEGKYYTGSGGTYTSRADNTLNYTVDGFFNLVLTPINYALAAGEVGYIYIYAVGGSDTNSVEIEYVEVTYA